MPAAAFADCVSAIIGALGRSPELKDVQKFIQFTRLVVEHADRNEIGLAEAVRISDDLHENFLFRWGNDDPGAGAAGSPPR